MGIARCENGMARFFKKQLNKSLEKGMEMFDQLSEAAPDREAGALTLKARADALLSGSCSFSSM